MAESDPVEEVTDALARFLVGESPITDALQRVVDLAARALPVAFTGITMLADDKPTTWVFSDPSASEIDQAQYEAGTGPCLDAFRTGEVLAIDSTERDERWPAFSQAAFAHGIRSTLSTGEPQAA